MSTLRYHEENCDIGFGEFKFGPLFMRLCYELGLDELGARTLTDPNDIERAQAFYSQIMSTESRLCQNLRVLILAMKGSMKEALFALTTALGSKTPVYVKKPEYILSGSDEISDTPVNVLKNKSVGGLWEGKVEQVVRRLEEAGQITKQTIDDFLCHTPSRRRRPLGILDHERKTSRRTRRTLQSTILLE